MALRKLRHLFIHLAGWLFFFALIISFTGRSPQGEYIWERFLSTAFLIFSGIYIILFYLNKNILLPAFYFRRQHAVYFSITILLLLSISFYQPFDRIVRPGNFRHDYFPVEARPHRAGPRPHGPGNPDIVSILLFIMVWSVSMGVEIFSRWRSSEERAVRAEADRANAELSFLKAQINPHFLFNTLNNIYSLAVIKSEATPGAIMKLSHMMRYITDEATLQFVLLEDEWKCIGNYIDLQRMRLNEKTSFSFSRSGNFEGIKIIPLVLMTFVENIFKYGVSNHEPSEIIISCTCSSGSIQFHCRNKIFPIQAINERTGIGLTNTRQRLEHAYGGNYSLNINTTDGFYSVHLNIGLT